MLLTKAQLRIGSLMMISNSNNYTYTSGLASGPLVLPVDNTHTTSNGLYTNSDSGTDYTLKNSPPSKQITTKDIADNAITTPKIANNAVTEAKLSRDAVHVVWDDVTSGNERCFIGQMREMSLVIVRII